MAAQHLQPLMADSILRQHERGLRRYFPLKAKSRKGLKYLREAFFIVYGREPKSNEDIFQAMFYHSFDKYVERFDGKLWVRTVEV
jgi:hypothetical protein